MSEQQISNVLALELAQRIIELDAAKDREVAARRYEVAAAVRDQREALEQALAKAGYATLLRNVQVALKGSFSRSPLIDRLEFGDTSIDERLVQRLTDAPLPVRWVIRNVDAASIGALKRRLDEASMLSPYYGARFPIFESAALNAAAHPAEWIRAATGETTRSKVKVIWILDKFWEIKKNDVSEKLLSQLREPSAEFAAFVGDADAAVLHEFTNAFTITA